MKKTILALLTAGALLAAGFAAALFGIPGKLVIRTGEEEAAVRTAPPPAPDRSGEVLDALDRLHEDLALIGRALDDAAAERARLAAALERSGKERAAALGRLEARLDERASRLEAAFRAALAARAKPAPPLASRPAPAPEPQPAPKPAKPATAPAPPPPTPPRRKSLAELLAARRRHDPRLERTRYELVPGSCKVGFDAVSTLHNFTAHAEKVRGELRLKLSAPGERPEGWIEVPVKDLRSGNEKRDREIHRDLSEGGHPLLRCELLGIEPGRKGGPATARVRFVIHGQPRDKAVPVMLEATPEHLLHIHGELPLRISEFGIEPARKLGFIKVHDDLTIWWDLYARPVRRGAGKSSVAR